MSESLNLQHVNIKFFVDGELTADLEQFINVFHRLVAEQAMDEMMIDVADYRHVPAGPGVVMVGLEADYAIDQKDGRYGLRYNRKAPLEGSNQDRLRVFDALKENWSATPETLAAAKPEIESFLRDGLGQGDFEVKFETDPRKLFGATIRLAAPVAAA